MKYLIIGADDLGYCPEQTRAILELYGQGLITSTTLLTTADRLQEEPAVRELSSRAIPCGVHLCISSDEERNRWKSLSGAPSLEDEEGLYASGREAARHAKRNDVRRELEAQYTYMISRGVVVDHADCHGGVLYGLDGRPYWADVFEFCRRHDLPLRFPRRARFIESQLGRKAPWPLRALMGYMRSRAESKGLLLPDDILSNPWNVERIGSYENLQQYYLNELDQCQDGVTEMFLHPSYPAEKGKEWQKRVWEFELLKSGCLAERAEKDGFTLISYRDLSVIQ